jgi:hypothetical protein
VQQAEAQIASGRAAIRRAEADLAEARRQLGVNERLSREQILATDALEESRARVRVLEAAIGQVDADVMRMEAARMQSLPQVAEAFTRLGFPAPRLSRLLPGGALVGQVPRRSAAAGAGAGAAQGGGLCRLRDHPRLCAHRPPLGWRRPGGLGLGGGHRRALGTLVLPLTPGASHAGERLTAWPGNPRIRT